jgi:DNA processing protein
MDTVMQTCSDPVVAWIGLSSVPGVGRATFKKLVERFGSPEAVLAASRKDLEEIDGLSGKVIDGIVSFSCEQAEAEFRRTKEAGIAIITADSPLFPANLKQVPDAPVYLYVKGSLVPGDGKAIAIVGTRKPTHYGTTTAYRMAYELAAAGLTVVSGMARGIDTQAHKGALAAKGRTIAVLGSGIDVAYPPENKGLMEAIGHAARGAVITENPFGTKPEAGYFPARNRIISGLSLGTVIIEAAEDSGSLITAQYALEQNRQLFAVPGNIGSPNSKGANSLIKQGAALVENAGDILRFLRIAAPQGGAGAEKRPLPPLTEEEGAVFVRITNEPRHIDAIMAECGATPGKISGVLIALELKGLVRQLPGKYYVKED